MKNKFKLISVVSAALVAVMIFIGFQGCSKNIDLQLSSDVKNDKIANLKPIANVGSEEEYNRVVNELNKQIKESLKSFTKNRILSKDGAGSIIFNIKKLPNRLKTTSQESGGSSSAKLDYGLYNIEVRMSWDYPLGTISTTSYLTGASLLFEYEQKHVYSYWARGDDWCVPTSDISGVVCHKIIVNGIGRTISTAVDFRVTGGLIQLK